MSERVPVAARSTRPAVAGLLGGAIALLALLLGSVVTGSNGFLEVVANGVTAFVPLPVFDAILSALGPFAKGVLFAGVAVAVPLAGAALASILVRVGRSPDGAEDGVAGGTLALAIAELVVLPLAGAGFVGLTYVGDPLALHLPLIVAAVLYGGVLVAAGRSREAVPAIEPPLAAPTLSSAAGDGSSLIIEPEPARLGAPEPGPAHGLPRRTFLGRALAALGVVSLLGSGLLVLMRVVAAGTKPLGRTATSGRPLVDPFGVTARVTPPDRFYTVAKDLVPTHVDRASWKLDVGGLVDRPRSFTLADVASLPRIEGYRTLQCISIQVTEYDSLISNGWWGGVRARDLLDAVGVQPSAKWVLWRSADGYTESIPLDVARDERTWLVSDMGGPGRALPDEHGAPLRVLIAGRYGMKQPKWLTGIQLADHDEPGFWVQRGWDERAIVRTYSRIDQPVDGDTVPSDAAFEVYGVASAGDRGISRVEVSADGGTSWSDAELEPATAETSEVTWRRWRASVRAAGAGRIVLTARATDGHGSVQNDVVEPPLPSGAGGLIQVTVSAVPGG